MSKKLDRRQFAGRVLGLTALTATVPSFLSKTGLALVGDAARRAAPIPGLKDDRVLVVVQLAGGNDGLNTLVPHGVDDYYRKRPKLGIEAKRVLRLNDTLGFHPELVELKTLYDQASLAVVQNVGYPNPNRSHFRATEIWETASPADQAWKTGWLGRYFDSECAGAKTAMLSLRLGDSPALTLQGERRRDVTLANPSLFSGVGEGPHADSVYAVNQVEPTGIAALDFVQRAANDTLTLSRQIRDATRAVKPAVEYPPFAFCQALRLVAQMIVAEVPTRVYYVSLGGFDTHATQAFRHSALLQELSQGLAAFHADLQASGHLKRVLLATFSEFGRRLTENKQAGTDHGTASVLFLLGGQVKPGLHGAPLDWKDLDEQGDLRARVDFRSVYAAILKDWFHVDPKLILKENFAPLPVV